MKNAVLSLLSPEYPWKEEFHHFTTIGSTNDELKKMARSGVPYGTVLVADHQSNGHGRLGRSFQSSAEAGVYLSILLRPNCPPKELMHLTCAAAVAMCDAVEQAAGFRPGIKWTNDLVHGKKKLGGILTELLFGKNGLVDYAIVGIGINCCQKKEDFSPDIQEIAASLSMVTGHKIDRSKIAAAMMDALYRMDNRLLDKKQDILQQYRENCITIGQEVSVVRGDEVRHGTALSVDDDGALLVRFTDGTIQAVSSGEVSVRGMYGYI